MNVKSPMLRSLSVLAIAATLGLGAAPAQTGAKKTLTGMVTDSFCGDTHMMKGMNDAECTRACVKRGAKYSLLVGKNAYTLEGHEMDVDKLAGAKATIQGTVNGTTMKVESVAAAK